MRSPDLCMGPNTPLRPRHLNIRQREAVILALQSPLSAGKGPLYAIGGRAVGKLPIWTWWYGHSAHRNPGHDQVGPALPTSFSVCPSVLSHPLLPVQRVTVNFWNFCGFFTTDTCMPRLLFHRYLFVFLRKGRAALYLLLLPRLSMSGAILLFPYTPWLHGMPTDFTFYLYCANEMRAKYLSGCLEFSFSLHGDRS